MPERLMERSVSASCCLPSKSEAIADMREQLSGEPWAAEAIAAAIGSLPDDAVGMDDQGYKVRIPFTGYHVRALVKIGVDGERSAVSISVDYVRV